ncbi:MAG TPA: tRNA pseudouridine(54/55) synthase Pus10 [Candidatus Acetothermia bacterium]|mgnify:CR=1 FL=1|nr:tRNA pseudouridine(54/55) synthase Pus10 [Candidatus Acetothermia bacterium]
MGSLDLQQVEDLAGRVLRAGPICDECLGRVAAGLGRGWTNAARGEQLRERAHILGVEQSAGPCWVCSGAFAEVEAWARRAAEAAKPYAFETYLFGVKLSPQMEAMESLYVERFPSVHRESIKHALNRALGKSFERQVAGPITVDFGDPHLSFVVDFASNDLSLHVRSVYVYGRYRKLARGIPQTRWPCRSCRGRGCSACSFTGKQYPTSVEEIIAAPLVRASGATTASLHGAGREDIDARMVGQGRPFVLELHAPMRRSFDLAVGQREVNAEAQGQVEISPLRFVHRSAVAWVKDMPAIKTYLAVIRLDSSLEQQELDRALAALVGEIEQETPLRVSHRRADKIRLRSLHEAEGTVEEDSTTVKVRLKGDGGLYIKELVSGDGGRTRPSLSEQLGMAARVVELDVLEVLAPSLPRKMELQQGLP